MKRIFVIMAALAVTLVVFGVPMASAQISEIFYYSDTGTDGDGTSKLFQVQIDPATGRGNLTPVPLSPTAGVIPLNHVDAIAATPDGTRVYLIQDGPGSTYPKLAYYDVATDSFFLVGEINTLGTSQVIDQASFSPVDGKLYITNIKDNKLYTLNPETLATTMIGTVKTEAGVTVDVYGADIAIKADGTFYLYTLAGVSGAPIGLYTLTLPATVTGNVIATLVAASPVKNFNGLAVRTYPYFSLIGSNNVTDSFVELDDTGVVVNSFPAYLGASAFNIGSGDMSSAPLVGCTRTIGYWKNHSWEGRTITVCGISVNEDLGKQLLTRANGKTYSMFIAQLIAAKLNNGGGFPDVVDAEDWLCLNANLTDIQNLLNPVVIPKTLKSTAAGYWEMLDEFNNMFHCAD